MASLAVSGGSSSSSSPGGAGGFWEGKVYKLREFQCVPASGTSKGVQFSQTMAKITLRLVLKGEAANLTAKDVTVELSSWELKVTAEGKSPEVQELLKPLSGDLHGDIRRDLSWWTLEKEAGGDNVFTIQLAKKDHKAWNTIWKIGMSHHRKAHFGWTPTMKPVVKKAEEILAKVKPGRPPPREKDPFIINRENLCSSYEDGQDGTTVTYRIHFDKEALEKACDSVCLGDLFGVDVMERHLKVFIRGDERSPILLGELGGSVVPEDSRWEITKAPPPPDFVEEEGQPAQPSAPPRKPAVPQLNTCLQVTLAKAKGSQRSWPRLLSENEIALERDSAPKLEELQAKALRAPSPDRSGWTPQDYAKESKQKGDGCFKRNEWRDASVFYTRAINHTPSDEKLYSNRSACYSKLKKFDKALADARKCISLNPDWPKAYFRQGQALRGLQRWEEALGSFGEGRFREPLNADWEKEIQKTEEEQAKHEAFLAEQRRLKREADMTTELNEATLVAEREAMVAVAEQALKAGKSRKEAGELALKGAELAKQRVHEMAKKKAMMVEDDTLADMPAPYRIVCEDGTLHTKGFAHTEKGMYFMGMTLMNSEKAPANQPWIEVRHPGKMRWSQGCALLRLKVTLPESVKTAADLDVRVTTTSLYIGTVGNADPVIMGEFERKVEPEGENFSWYLIPDEKPPMLDMCLDKDAAEVYATFSYTTLLWPRLFRDDVMLGEGLFEADLTDLPPHLLEKFRREQARANEQSLNERMRRKKMTEEEIAEETARNWNDEFARHGLPHRLDTNEDKMLDGMRY